LTLALLAGLALAVTPAHATLAAPASRTIEVRNTGRGIVSVDVKVPAPQWLRIQPARLVLRAGSRGVLTVRARADARARPGDHELLVLLLARPTEASRIAVRLRLGIRVRVRVPGRLVRRVVVRGLRARRHRRGRLLLVSLANAGNVTEQLHGHVTVDLMHGRRLVSRLRYRGTREVFPGARAVVALPYVGRARGLVTAIVRVRAAERRYRLRL
jgi:hypothetical protein